MRLFVAVDVPEPLRARLATALEPLREAVPGARWSPPENWHVTLRFLGSVWPRLRQWVEEGAAAAAESVEPFETRLTVLGAFPAPNRARVLWAGLHDPGGFAALSRALDSALHAEFPPESRPFTPHLTVARIREQVSLPEGSLDADVSSDPFEVRELVLYRSRLQRPAARYEVLGRYPLGGGPRGR